MILDTLSTAYSTPVEKLCGPDNRIAVFDSGVLMSEMLDRFSESMNDIVLLSQYGEIAGFMTAKEMTRILRDHDNLLRPANDFMVRTLHVFDGSLKLSEVMNHIRNIESDHIVVRHSEGGFCIIYWRQVLTYCYHHLTPLVMYECNILHYLTRLVEQGEKGLLQMATTDALTGIGNRRMLEEIFDSHQKMIDESIDISLYLVMYDIDDFKLINDTFGHSVGDNVLRQMVELVSASIRKSDIMIRWGGEEFLILLYYADEESVVTVAEHLRERINAFAFESIIKVSCSFGITPIKRGETLQKTVERADKALYQAKAEGKNCVRIADE